MLFSFVLFIQKAPVWEITGAEFSKSNVHTADGISIRFPRVTRIRDDKDWKTANDLPHLKVKKNSLLTWKFSVYCRKKKPNLFLWAITIDRHYHIREKLTINSILGNVKMLAKELSQSAEQENTF